MTLVPATPDPSAWRNFPKPRPRPGPQRKRPTPLLFYGYPAAVIADACAVKLGTALADVIRSGTLLFS